MDFIYYWIRIKLVSRLQEYDKSDNNIGKPQSIEALFCVNNIL